MFQLWAFKERGQFQSYTEESKKLHVFFSWEDSYLYNSTLVICPEGAVSNNKCLWRFKPGSFKTDLPVQPVVVEYPKTFNTFNTTGQTKVAVIKLFVRITYFLRMYTGMFSSPCFIFGAELTQSRCYVVPTFYFFVIFWLFLQQFLRICNILYVCEISILDRPLLCRQKMRLKWSSQREWKTFSANLLEYLYLIIIRTMLWFSVKHFLLECQLKAWFLKARKITLSFGIKILTHFF